MMNVYAAKRSAEAYAWYKYTGKRMMIGRGRGNVVPLERKTMVGIRWARDRTHFILVFEDYLEDYVHLSGDQAQQIAENCVLIREG